MMGATIAFTASCGEGIFGKRVKEPFRGSNYESNNRWFRAVGKAESSKDNIAKSKADLDAKNQLAGQVSTNIRAVSDQYLGQTENERAADVADKFQTLVREVMNTNLADLRKVGEKKYYSKETQRYTVFVAYEIRKNAMFRFMKRQAKADPAIDARTKALIEEIIDSELAKIEDDDE